MWVVIVIGMGLVAVSVALALTLVRRNRGIRSSSGARQMTGDEWATMGFVYIGAGIALAISLGPQMIFMVAIGTVFLAMGMRLKREEPK